MAEEKFCNDPCFHKLCLGKYKQFQSYIFRKRKEKSGVLQQFDFNLPQEFPSEGTVVLFFCICSAYIRKVGNSEGRVLGTVGRASGVYAKTAENF